MRYGSLFMMAGCAIVLDECVGENPEASLHALVVAIALTLIGLAWGGIAAYYANYKKEQPMNNVNAVLIAFVVPMLALGATQFKGASESYVLVGLDFVIGVITLLSCLSGGQKRPILSAISMSLMMIGICSILGGCLWNNYQALPGGVASFLVGFLLSRIGSRKPNPTESVLFPPMPPDFPDAVRR